MAKNDNLPEEEKFSDDPEENLRMQNDFLKLKMMAESGAIFGGEGGLPPDIENQFLKNILEFEKNNAAPNQKKVRDILGNPKFEREESLDDINFEQAYKKLMKYLKKHCIVIDFSRERSDRFKYNFITGELFNHETSLAPVKGMTTYFSYEEFHPDHEMDIKETTENFLNAFLDKKLTAEAYYLEDKILEPDGKEVAKAEYMKRMEAMYEATKPFENFSFKIEKIGFDLKDNTDEITGMGFSEGTIKYDLTFQNGERKLIDGPFKIYFTLTWDVWSIFFFFLAGFNMHKK